MVLVGLTGGIGAGKSTVSAELAARGATVVDADAITKELQQPGQPVLLAMVERFGPEILAADGTLDRAKVASIVFNDADALKDLNGIVHPAVGLEIARRIGEAGQDDVVVLDVPLLVESGRDDMVGTIVVDCPVDLAVSRLVDHRGFDEADARARISRQASREDRLAKADLIIDNAGGLDELRPQIDACWRWLEGLRAAAADGAPAG